VLPPLHLKFCYGNCVSIPHIDPRLAALGFFGPSASAAAASPDERVKLFVGNSPGFAGFAPFCLLLIPASGNLSDGANHSWLSSTFASTGVDVLEIVMVPDKATGIAKGSAFVFVAGKKNADRLILLLHECVACPDAPQVSSRQRRCHYRAVCVAMP
jgi:hypothetical protein